MPSSIRPGDVLADRYRLVDLLAESRGGRFWRAHDRVLERHVALHVIAEDDERADALLEAARRSATVHDRRLLRVLDADKADGYCYVVNEWGSGDSLDIMLTNEGPLTARRAAWLVSEVAASIAVGHDAGVAHGRLVPENVLVDRVGAVRLIGFAVDAAMHGLPPGRVSTDVDDLGGLLYSALTGRWAGTSPSTVPPAPLEQGRVLRPRQVRAGIPRPLDALCDEIVNPYAGTRGARIRETHDLATARGIGDYLTAFVGDPTGMAEAEAALGHRDTGTIPVLTPLPDPPVREEPEVEADPGAEPEPGAASEPTEAVPVPGSEAEPGPAPELPTQAGLPVFDDDSDDVSWIVARAEPPPPPPPFEDPPERPLFAPDPAEGPARRPRNPAAVSPPTQVAAARTGHTAGAAGPAGPGAGPGGGPYWPWDTGTGTGITPATDPEDTEVPGRSWLRLAAAVAGCLLLLVAVVVAYNLGRGRTPLGAVPEDDQSTPSRAVTSAPPAPISGIVATDLDPQGDPPYEEYPELTPLAVDGKPTTAWHTATYLQQLGPAGLKTGVGLVLDLGGQHDVASVDLTFVGAPTSYSLFVTDEEPTGIKGLSPVARATADQIHSRTVLDTPATGRYVVVWLTSLPAVDGGFRGEVAEATVRG